MLNTNFNNFPDETILINTGKFLISGEYSETMFNELSPLEYIAMSYFY